ncbi:hypothetical protein R1flu_015494 [Riccia fluitans]|uniref:Uncharacterized protein n=1 Tax=Riccia fluitans TaxID=41844 RepID=A0ABD1YJC2_9MARC
MIPFSHTLLAGVSATYVLEIVAMGDLGSLCAERINCEKELGTTFASLLRLHIRANGGVSCTEEQECK